MIAIRPAAVADRPAIEAVVRAAFAREEEVEFARRIWSLPEYLPELDLVALDAGEIVGHVLHSRASIGIALGPLAVIPDRQGEGIGGALVEESLRLADAAGFPLIALLGHKTYYPRFGFVPGQALGIEPGFELGDPEAFMVRPLAAYEPVAGGVFRYAWDE